MHTPAVERLLAASRGQVEAAYARYMAAHDALVVSDLLALFDAVAMPCWHLHCTPRPSGEEFVAV